MQIDYLTSCLAIYDGVTMTEELQELCNRWLNSRRSVLKMSIEPKPVIFTDYRSEKQTYIQSLTPAISELGPVCALNMNRVNKLFLPCFRPTELFTREAMAALCLGIEAYIIVVENEPLPPFPSWADPTNSLITADKLRDALERTVNAELELGIDRAQA